MLMHKKHHDQYYVLWLEIEINTDNEELKKNLSNTYNNFQIYDDPNTCINFVSNLPIDEINVFLILIGIECEHIAEMIIDLPLKLRTFTYKTRKRRNSSHQTTSTFDFRQIILKIFFMPLYGILN
jgi:hypothetical protein